MDFLKDLAHASKQDIFLIVIGLEALFCAASLICSFVVADTANAGFNCVLTAFLNCSFTAGSYYVLNYSKAPLAIGFLIGCSGTMMFLNLMTSVYWGQLSKCDKHFDGKADQYSCSEPIAYGAVSVFAVLLFLIQLFSTITLALWRDDFISEEGGGSGHSSSIHHSMPYTAVSNPATTNYNNLPASADL